MGKKKKAKKAKPAKECRLQIMEEGGRTSVYCNGNKVTNCEVVRVDRYGGDFITTDGEHIVGRKSFYVGIEIDADY